MPIRRNKNFDSWTLPSGRVTMTRQLTRDDCDLVLQGAVVLACGGGGPLHFARLILDDLYEDDYAAVIPPENVADDEWMAMIAMVGTPSKVHKHRRESAQVNVRRMRKVSPWGTPLSSPRGSPQCSRSSSPTQLAQQMEGTPMLNNRGRSTSCASLLNSPSTLNGAGSMDDLNEKPGFYEIVKRVMRVKFLNSGSQLDLSKLEPTEDGELRTPNNAVRNTLSYLQQQCQIRASDNVHYPRFKGFTKFSHILTGELGAVNMATALYLSATFDVAIVDGDGAGRSVPLVNQITYADKFTVSPTVIMSPQPGPDFQSIASTTLDFPCGSEKMVEEVAAALISDQNGPFSPFIGYGTYAIKGQQMGNVPVFETYSMALKVGQALTNFAGEERISRISEVLDEHKRPNEVVFHGYVTAKVLNCTNVKDTGHLEVTDINDPQNRLELWYKNEVILAGPAGKTPTYMAPDSICIVPAVGEPVDISTIPKPEEGSQKLEVYILVVQADPKIKTDKVIKSFESIYKLFKRADQSLVYQQFFTPFQASDKNSELSRYSSICSLSSEDEGFEQTKDLQENLKTERIDNVRLMVPVPQRKLGTDSMDLDFSRTRTNES